MRGSDNTVFKAMEYFSNFFLLNTLWLLFCLPVFTIYPATKAMLAVTRHWILTKEEKGVFSHFLYHFKESFFQSFFLGIGIGTVSFVLFADFFILMEVEFIGSRFLFVLLVFVTIAYFFINIYLLLMLVNYELPSKTLIKNALFFSIAHIFHTLFFLIIVSASLLLVYILPFLILILGSLTSYFIYSIFNSMVNKSPALNKFQHSDS